MNLVAAEKFSQKERKPNKKLHKNQANDSIADISFLFNSSCVAFQLVICCKGCALFIYVVLLVGLLLHLLLNFPWFYALIAFIFLCSINYLLLPYCFGSVRGLNPNLSTFIGSYTIACGIKKTSFKCLLHFEVKMECIRM